MHPPGVGWITPPQCLPQCGQVRYHENKPFRPQIPPRRIFSRNAEKNQTRHGFFWTQGSQQGVGHSLLKRPREKEQLSERWNLGKRKCTWQQSDRKLSLADTEGRMLHSAATKSRQSRIHRDLWTSKFEKTPCPSPQSLTNFLIIHEMITKCRSTKLQSVCLTKCWHKQTFSSLKAVFQNWLHIFLFFWL